MDLIDLTDLTATDLTDFFRDIAEKYSGKRKDCHMKRTDFEKRERELKRVHKRVVKEEQRDKTALADSELTVSNAINRLSNLFQYDKEEIYNILHSEDIHAFILEMQENFDEKKLENVLRKSVKKTGVKHKQEAYEQLKTLVV